MPLQRTIVVVENESLLRDLIARSLETAGFDVSTAANAADAKRAVKATDPDICVVDIELGPGPNGFDLADYLAREAPDVGVVFLTNLPDPRFADRDTKTLTQKQAYLRKSQLVDSKELIEAINAVLMEVDVDHYRHDQNLERPLAALSRRQISVLKLVAEGHSNNQIAEELGVDAQGVGNARVEATRMYLSAAGAVTVNE